MLRDKPALLRKTQVSAPMIGDGWGVTVFMRAVLQARVSNGSDRSPIDALVTQIGKLVRHRGYVREKVVSAMLVRYLPSDGGYAWNGEPALHARLRTAALDMTTMDHLIASARREISMIEERSRL